MKRPRLNRRIVLAAAEGHYGKKRVAKVGGPVGITMTVSGTDYSFDRAFRRMWRAAWAEIERQEAE